MDSVCKVGDNFPRYDDDNGDDWGKLDDDDDDNRTHSEIKGQRIRRRSQQKIDTGKTTYDVTDIHQLGQMIITYFH